MTKVKDVDPLLRRSRVVYKVPCSCGQWYIGETKRVLETRLKEHQAATRRGETGKSAIAEHVWTNNHSPLWNEITVLDKVRDNSRLLIKEAFNMLTDKQSLLNRHQEQLLQTVQDHSGDVLTGTRSVFCIISHSLVKEYIVNMREVQNKNCMAMTRCPNQLQSQSSPGRYHRQLFEIIAMLV